MASYPPPIDNVGIFDTELFKSSQNATLTISEGDKRYLRFPNAQGTENLQNIVINGTTTARERVYQEIDSGANWGAVNGYYALDKDKMCIPDPTSAGVKAVSTWNARAAPISIAWGAVAWSPQLALFVAVANSTTFTTDKVITSPDGITWTARTIPTDASGVSFRAITWSPEYGYFLAVGTVAVAPTYFIRSSDGITWTSQTITQTTQLVGITWSPELRVFVASGGTTIISSSPDNGVTLTWSSSGLTGFYNDVVWSPELKIFTAVGGNIAAVSSTGAGGWVTSSIPLTTPLSVAWSSQLNLFAAGLAAANNNLLTSPDGLNWTVRTSPYGTGQAVRKMIWADELGLFIGFSDFGGRIFSSPDGITWTARATPASFVFYGACWSPELGIAVAPNFTASSANAVATSNLLGRPPTSYNVFDTTSVAFGRSAGISQGALCVAVGNLAGSSAQGAQSVAVGNQAAQSNQGQNSVAVGVLSGNSSQGGSSVAVGPQAGQTTQGGNSVAIGNLAGTSSQGAQSVAIGPQSGQTTQGINSVAVGNLAGNSSQGQNSVAVGVEAGETGQGASSVAIGNLAGTSSQGAQSVAIGPQSGQTTQGINSVAIGNLAGQSSQGGNSVAIGVEAGRTSQGASSVALGDRAGQTNQHANSIILNATGVALNSDGASRLFIDPIRSAANSSVVLYNTTTKEVTYQPNTLPAYDLEYAPLPSPTSFGVAPLTSWSNAAAPASNAFQSVCVIPEYPRLVAVASNGAIGSQVITSDDGITWAIKPAAANNQWRSVAWSLSLNRLVAVADSGTGNRVMTSNNFGDTWTTQSTALGLDNLWNSVVWAPELSLFVAVAGSGTNRVMTSPDGITWTGRIAAQAIVWNSVCWSPELSLFVAVGTDSTVNKIMTSSNGIDWFNRPMPVIASLNTSWTSVCWSAELGLFVASSNAVVNSTRIITSPDGINWTGIMVPATDNWKSVVWAKELGIFLVAGLLGENLTSNDGVTWVRRTGLPNQSWQSVIWSPEFGIFVVVGAGNTGNGSTGYSALNGRYITPFNMYRSPYNSISQAGNWTIQGVSFTSPNAVTLGSTAANTTIRTNSTGAGGTISLTGGTGLLSGSAGGNSGQHLVITINGTAYKIVLLNI